MGKKKVYCGVAARQRRLLQVCECRPKRFNLPTVAKVEENNRLVISAESARVGDEPVKRGGKSFITRSKVILFKERRMSQAVTAEKILFLERGGKKGGVSLGRQGTPALAQRNDGGEKGDLWLGENLEVIFIFNKKWRKGWE